MAPWDTVLFKRGATCLGTYAPVGIGSSTTPSTISPYGAGTARPVIDGNGAVDMVVLRNMEGVELSGLEVTNAKGLASLRRGVYLVLENYGIARHMVVDNMYVHDIKGNDAKGSGGILASVTGDAKASNYAGARITNNRVDHVNRTGIAAVASGWEEHPEVGSATITKPWTANTGIVISPNNVLDTGGDALFRKQRLMLWWRIIASICSSNARQATTPAFGPGIQMAALSATTRIPVARPPVTVWPLTLTKAPTGLCLSTTTVTQRRRLLSGLQCCRAC
ncbi:right-handed parallel beta-helix repeat-containing protein [Arthrobacter sp. TMN-49]